MSEAVAAAPAAAATAAPASTPASTPASVTPSNETTAVTTPAPESTPTAAPVNAEPQSADFGDDVESFVKAHWEWEKQQGDKPVETPVTEEAKPEEAKTEETPEEKPEGTPAEDPKVEPESLTPESLNALFGEDEALKAAVEANPAAKGALFKMARENAKLGALAEVFPTKEAAEFAAEVANRTVGIKTAFQQAAIDPAKIGDAFDLFVDEFRIVDEKGQPVLDAAGNPKMGEDFDLLVNHLVTNYFDGEIADAEARLKGGKYGSETAKENDEALVQAYKFIKTFKDSSSTDLERPDLSDVPESVRSYYEKKDAELKEREAQAKGQKTEQARKEAQAARQAHESKVASTVGGEFGKRLTEMIDERVKGGLAIPQYALQAKDPATGMSYFAKDVYDTFLRKTVGIFDGKTKRFSGGQPQLRDAMAKLEMLPPSEQSAQQRVEFFRQLREDYLPGIIDRKVAEIQGQERTQRTAAAQKKETARASVPPEPKGGTAPQPAPMSMADAMKQAREAVTKESQGQYISDADREERAMQKAFALMNRR